jgi:hypothetical protein
MRKAELIIAGLFFLFAGVLMREAVRLHSGWTAVGPGSGFVPFWLALAMMGASLVILVQAAKTQIPPGAPRRRPGVGRRDGARFTSESDHVRRHAGDLCHASSGSRVQGHSVVPVPVDTSEPGHYAPVLSSTRLNQRARDAYT